MRAAMLRFLVFVLVLAGLAAGAVLYAPTWLEGQMQAEGPAVESQVFAVEPGQSARQVVTRLEAAGLIRSEALARLALRLKPRGFKAGEYELPARASMAEVFDILASGRSRSYSVTVPEGLTSKQIVALLNGVPELTGTIAELPPEGSLLPDTYFIHRGDDRQALIQRMQAALQQTFWPLWEARQEGLPFDRPEQAVTLASIVERETGLASERPVVASVFINRLKQGWRLQADPTLVYFESDGLGKLGRGLKRSELDRDHPYNTYTRGGLPPGPIAHVGKAALQAVLAPADTNYFYFVADGSGGHAFAETLDAHNRNVKKWRQVEQGNE